MYEIMDLCISIKLCICVCMYASIYLNSQLYSVDLYISPYAGTTAL